MLQNKLNEIFSLETAFIDNIDNKDNKDITADIYDKVDLLIEHKNLLNEQDYYMLLNKVICNMYDVFLSFGDSYKNQSTIEALKSYVKYNEDLMQDEHYANDFRALVLQSLQNETSHWIDFKLWDFILAKYSGYSVDRKLSYILNFDRIMSSKKDILSYKINYDPKTEWLTDIQVIFTIKDFSAVKDECSVFNSFKSLMQELQDMQNNKN